jgi:hypothetical protein
VSCTEACSEALLLCGQREHCIHPTYGEWMNLVEARTVMQAVVRGEQSSSELEPLLRTAAPTLGPRITATINRLLTAS